MGDVLVFHRWTPPAHNGHSKSRLKHTVGGCVFVCVCVRGVGVGFQPLIVSSGDVRSGEMVPRATSPGGRFYVGDDLGYYTGYFKAGVNH